MLIRFFFGTRWRSPNGWDKKDREILCSQTDTLKGRTPANYAEQKVKYWLFEKRLVLHFKELYGKIFYAVSGNLKFFF